MQIGNSTVINMREVCVEQLYNKLRSMLVVELLLISLVLLSLWAYLYWMETKVNIHGATLVQVETHTEEVWS